MQTIEKLSDYKRALKDFIRGVIKTKIFANEKGGLDLTVAKTEGGEKVITIVADNGTFVATFDAIVHTRIFNKVDEDLFVPLQDMFNKRTGFGGLNVKFE